MIVEEKAALPPCCGKGSAFPAALYRKIRLPNLAAFSDFDGLEMPQSLSLVMLSPSPVILSEAKNPSSCAQGKLREESLQFRSG